MNIDERETFKFSESIVRCRDYAECFLRNIWHSTTIVCLGVVFIYSFSPAIKIAVTSYGIIIGLVVVSLRLTRERDDRLSTID